MSTTAPTPKLWTQEQFGDFAQLTESQVQYLRKTGKGPAFTKIGREIRYVPGTVQRWVIDRQQITSKG